MVTPDGKATEYQEPAGAESIATGADGFDVPQGTVAPVALTAGTDGNVWFVTGKPAAMGRITLAGDHRRSPVGDDDLRGLRRIGRLLGKVQRMVCPRLVGRVGRTPQGLRHDHRMVTGGSLPEPAGASYPTSTSDSGSGIATIAALNAAAMITETASEVYTVRLGRWSAGRQALRSGRTSPGLCHLRI